jgi:hypothetical protein
MLLVSGQRFFDTSGYTEDGGGMLRLRSAVCDPRNPVLFHGKHENKR